MYNKMYNKMPPPPGSLMAARAARPDAGINCPNFSLIKLSKTT